MEGVHQLAKAFMNQTHYVQARLDELQTHPQIRDNDGLQKELRGFHKTLMDMKNQISKTKRKIKSAKKTGPGKERIILAPRGPKPKGNMARTIQRGPGNNAQISTGERKAVGRSATIPTVPQTWAAREAMLAPSRPKNQSNSSHASYPSHKFASTFPELSEDAMEIDSGHFEHPKSTATQRLPTPVDANPQLSMNSVPPSSSSRFDYPTLSDIESIRRYPPRILSLSAEELVRFIHKTSFKEADELLRKVNGTNPCQS